MDIQAEKFLKNVKVLKTTVDYNVRRHQKIEQNKTKSRAGRPKATRAKDNFIRVTSFCDRRLTAPLNKCCEKKYVKFHCNEKTL